MFTFSLYASSPPPSVSPPCSPGSSGDSAGSSAVSSSSSGVSPDFPFSFVLTYKNQIETCFY